jgi:hypothetical protein
MQSIQKFVSILLLFVFSLGCETTPEEPTQLPPPETIYEAAPDVEPGTGRLQVYVFKLVGRRYRPIRNAEVVLYLTFQDLERKVPLDFGVTNQNGNINFGVLNVGNYYIETTLFEGNLAPRSKILVAQVQNSRSLTKNFSFD